jgi:hypothetical protein
MTRIGIDPGVHTGYSVIKDGKYIDMGTLPILSTMIYLERFFGDTDTEVYIENPFKWTGKRTPKGTLIEEKGKDQGVGSVKAHYKIWLEWFEIHNIKYQFLTPAQVGSFFDNPKVFKAATKWKKDEEIHARDAATMIFRFFKP